MGFLNNTSVTVDAVLTKKGRELLARGQDEFKITKFGEAGALEKIKTNI